MGGSGKDSRNPISIPRMSPLCSLEELLTTQCDRFSQEEVSGGGAWEEWRDGEAIVKNR